MAEKHSSGFSVRVVEFSDRKHFQMQFADPLTGRKKTRSTGIERTGRKRDRTEAERVAAQWEAELREGRYHSPAKMTWAEFRERYEAEVLASLANATGDKVCGIFNAVERHLSPAKLRDLTAARLSYFQSKLRELGRAETTIKSSMAHLAAALGWAVRMGLLHVAPKIDSPRRAASGKVMKGRPIVAEEFERMLAKIEAGLLALKKPQRKSKPRRQYTAATLNHRSEKRVDDAALAAPSWRHFLQGLWLSGLRLGESLELSWDDESKLCVDLAGKRPMLRIPAALEKGNQDRVLPMAPEFAEFLLATPEAERVGYVFKLCPRRMRGSGITADRASRTISEIGKAAGVKVNSKTVAGKPVVKYASAHDLRRSFGERWASRVMPQVLMELMRHEAIDTTLRYYVGRNAQSTADVLWEAHAKAKSNTSGNSGQNSASQHASTFGTSA